MDKALYLAMNGAVNNNRAQSIHANNLANIGTSGFRADFAQARAMQVFGPTVPSRAYAQTEQPGTRFDSGALNATGQSLDVAINGSGLFAVQTADGGEAYTREGDLSIDVDGTLRNGNGFVVVGEEGPLLLPPAESVTIGVDGTVSIRPVGQGPETLVEVGRLKRVNPDIDALMKGPDGLFRLRDGSQPPSDATVRVASGVLEASNVNAVEEMVQILSLARQFEVQVKLMHATETNDEAAARLLQG